MTPGRAAQPLSWHQTCSLLSSQHHCHMCATTATGNAGSQDPSSRSTWSHRSVVHTPASVLCRCGDGQQARTRCAGGHTHRVNTHTVSSLSSTCHNDYTVAHGTACTLIVVTPHAPETCNSFNLGQVCRNTSGPVMPVSEGCPTQHTHASCDNIHDTPRKSTQSEPHHRKAQ